MRFILILIFGISSCCASNVQQLDFSSFDSSATVNVDLYQQAVADKLTVIKPKFRKLKAILLALFLGHFGVHRIYLGTSANVPVVYSLTLGGGLGLLPLLDIIALLSTKDWEKFSNNDKVFMWSK